MPNTTTNYVFAIVSGVDIHDYSRYIKFKGMGWAREDIDSAKAGRTKDGVMHRGKVGTKRKLMFQVMPAPQEVLAQLDDDLSAESFTVYYLDLHQRNMEKTFYCSKFECTLLNAREGHEEGVWCDGKFDVIEV